MLLIPPELLEKRDGQVKPPPPVQRILNGKVLASISGHSFGSSKIHI
jgi:hypothetical protein